MLLLSVSCNTFTKMPHHKNIIIQFRLVAEADDENSETFILKGRGEEFKLSKHVEIDQDDFSYAEASKTEYSMDCIDFQLNSAGTEKLSALTAHVWEENYNMQLGVVIDNQLVNVARIKEHITGGKGRIAGKFTKQEVADIVKRINE